MILNKGTGAGGANTNLLGKNFEKKIDNKVKLLENGFQEIKFELGKINHKLETFEKIVSQEPFSIANHTIFKMRIPKKDLPLVMINYIRKNNIIYDYTLDSFTNIIYNMLKEDYDFGLSSLPPIKSKLDILFGEPELVKTMIISKNKINNDKNNKTKYEYGNYLLKILSDKKIIFLTQNGLKIYMKEFYNIDLFRYPDEAYLIEYNNGKKIIKILEIKEQNVEGSVETKLWSAPALKREYELVLGEDFEVQYAFAVNKFLQDKFTSKLLKYIILNKILEEFTPLHI